MSNRTQVFAGTSKNPATKFLDWKSDNKSFSYYDKEEKKNVAIPLPFKFIFLDELSTVKGWHDSSESGIFSNEVKYLSKEVITVKAFKGGTLAKGLYNEIKEQFKNCGGHYSKSVYIMTEDGLLSNVQFKGSATKEWGEFVKSNKSKITNNWITVADATESKKGKVVFSVPNFTLGAEMEELDGQRADLCFDTLEDYLKVYLTKDLSTEAVAEEVDDEDELEF